MVLLRRVVWCFWASLLLSSLITYAFKSSVNAETVTHVKFIPQLVESHNAGEMFTAACVIEDVNNLCFVGIMFSWDTDWLSYVSHTFTMPVEDYPFPQAPSPYPGIIHEPIAVVQDRVEISAGTYESAAVNLGCVPLFNGSGTVFTMTFQVTSQPQPENPCSETYIDTILHFEQIDLADPDAQPIVHTEQDGIVRIYAYQSSTCALYPRLKVMPETFGGVPANDTFPVDVWLMGGDGHDLDAFWDVSGADFYLHFNASLIEATNVIIDPYGVFSDFFSGPIVEIAKEINNTAGTVRVAFNVSDGPHFTPFGLITIATVEFKALLEASEWPPPSCVLGLGNPPPRPMICEWGETPVYLEGYQHPEREMCPWNSSDSRVALPNFVENATYFTRFDQGVLVTVLAPLMKNHSVETLWLNVTANVPVDDWWYSLNSGSNVSFTPNSTISVSQCENSLVVYAGSLGMEGSANVQFHALTGDLDRDRDVDIFDIVLLAGVYGSYLGHPDYVPEYDINPPPSGNGEIDIFDIVSAAGNYGDQCTS